MKNLVLLSLLVTLSSPAFAEGPAAIATFNGVKASVQKVPLVVLDPDQKAILKENRGDFTYDIRFGLLREDAFTGLKKYFGGVNAVYDGKKNYRLLDFMPAKIQALFGRRLEVTSREPGWLNDVDLFYKNGGSVLSAINCWGTAYEITRDSSERTPFTAFLAGREAAQAFFESSLYSDAVKAQDSRPGDVILFYITEDGQNKLQHAAVALGDGYYFEKTDTGSENFFRIARYEDMRDRMKDTFKDRTDSSGKPVQTSYRIRRFHLAGKTNPPLPEEIFSVHHVPDSLREYADAVDASEDKNKLTLFIDARLGGGEEVTLQDIQKFPIRLNPATRQGELDPASKETQRFVPSGMNYKPK